MQIDKALISKLEHLTRLELSDAERSEIQQDLNKVLTMVDKLNELDIDNVEPLIYMNEVKNRERDDVVANQLSTEEALRNAPNNDGQYFRVPKFVK